MQLPAVLLAPHDIWLQVRHAKYRIPSPGHLDDCDGSQEQERAYRQVVVSCLMEAYCQ